MGEAAPTHTHTVRLPKYLDSNTIKICSDHDDRKRL